MELYFKPLNGQLESRSRYFRASFEEIVGQTNPPGEWFVVVEQNERPADSPLYTVTSNDVESGAHPAYPVLRILARTWVRTRKPQAEIDALIEARREVIEGEQTRRMLELVLRYLNRLSAVPAVQNAVPQALRDRVATAVQRLQENDAEAAALKTQAAQGVDVDVRVNP